MIELAVMAGLLLNCEISKYTTFDKKNYYYPDLPYAYQITQLNHPICTNGCVPVQTSEGEREIHIKQIHMEEDAGKLVHIGKFSNADFNRTSVPLIEIVSQPDFRSSEEVLNYLNKLKSMFRESGISECEEGAMRCDVNISVRPEGSTELGVRSEIKNMSSFEAIAKAIRMDKEKCDALLLEYERGDQTNKYPIHVDMEDIDIWYPYKFSDKIDYCLLYLASISKHIGSIIEMPLEAVESCLFVDRYEETTEGREPRDEEGITMQTRYMLEYLKESGYIEGSFSNNIYRLRLTPKAYERVDELQKNSRDSRIVLVAMKFGIETNPLREAIREGIKKAKYTPIFIDEVQHNDLITPELLKYIRQSKFVVVDLTHRNNGAYFEEGYAMGLNKPVIQLCKRSLMKELHFDIAQKNTIGWEKENDIPELLMRRIKATIE